MILLNAHQLEFSVPGRTLLSEADLSLAKGEKVGLVGRNGSGKSTLLKLLSGHLKADSGSVTLRGQTRLRYLDQLPRLDDCKGLSLHEAVVRGEAELFKLRERYEEVCQAMQAGDTADQAELEEELNSLTDKLTHHDAWDLETKAKTLLTGLGFPDPQRSLDNLSGGELKRVAMARTLLVPPDILLLDEPTNHLDIATIAWLEEFLQKANFAVLMVTHDRYFLERVCQKIVEVADETLQTFTGNYSDYLESKAQREAQKQRQQERFDNVMRQEKAWLRQGPKARSTKQKARLQRIQGMLDHGSGITMAEGTTEDEAWDLGTQRLGKKVATAKISKHRILKPLEFVLEPGERVGLVGANGSGKTTLLDLLAGRREAEDGTLERGETVKTAYLDQHSVQLDELGQDTRVLDAVKDVATSIPLSNGKELTAARLCEMFLFSGSRQQTPIKKLSGGERKRLELLRLLMARPNVILADEPTNDLDIETLSRLEFFLDNFPGSVCVASHDRFLLQRLCDRLLIFRDGVVEEVNPSVLDQITSDFFEVSSPPSVERKVSVKPTQEVSQNAKRKLSYKESKELAELEESIPKWEEKIEQLATEIAAKADSYTAIKDLVVEKQDLETKLEAGVERWAELEELRESLQS